MELSIEDKKIIFDAASRITGGVLSNSVMGSNLSEGVLRDIFDNSLKMCIEYYGELIKSA